MKRERVKNIRSDQLKIISISLPLQITMSVQTIPTTVLVTVGVRTRRVPSSAHVLRDTRRQLKTQPADVSITIYSIVDIFMTSSKLAASA